MPLHCSPGSHNRQRNNHIQRNRNSSTNATYDMSEAEITRCVVKSEGRKEVRVQAFFELRNDPKVKGRKQKSFSISKFGLEGAWARANRCKEFIEQLHRFPMDESEVDAFQGKTSTGLINDQSGAVTTRSLASSVNTGISSDPANMFNTIDKENLAPPGRVLTSNGTEQWGPFRSGTSRLEDTSTRQRISLLTGDPQPPYQHRVGQGGFRATPKAKLGVDMVDTSGKNTPLSGLNHHLSFSAVLENGRRSVESNSSSAAEQDSSSSSSQRRTMPYMNQSSSSSSTWRRLGGAGPFESQVSNPVSKPNAFLPCPPPDGSQMMMMMGVMNNNNHHRRPFDVYEESLTSTGSAVRQHAQGVSRNGLDLLGNGTCMDSCHFLEDMDSKSFLKVTQFLTSHALSLLECASRSLRRQVAAKSGAWRACFFSTLPHMLLNEVVAENEKTSNSVNLLPSSGSSTSNNSSTAHSTNSNTIVTLKFPFKTATTNLYKIFLAYEYATRNWLLYKEVLLKKGEGGDGRRGEKSSGEATSSSTKSSSSQVTAAGGGGENTSSSSSSSFSSYYETTAGSTMEWEGSPMSSSSSTVCKPATITGHSRLSSSENLLLGCTTQPPPPPSWFNNRVPKYSGPLFAPLKSVASLNHSRGNNWRFGGNNSSGVDSSQNGTGLSDEQEFKELFSKCRQTVEYIHQQTLKHRDALKPSGESDTADTLPLTATNISLCLYSDVAEIDEEVKVMEWFLSQMRPFASTMGLN